MVAIVGCVILGAVIIDIVAPIFKSKRR